jgi:hypothetical protein
MKLAGGAMIVVLIAAPWFILAGLRTDGEFLRRFFLTENLGRAATAFENHRGGIWYYPVAIAIGFFPWSMFLATMGLGMFRSRGGSAGDRIALGFLVSWIAVQVGVFSLAATKLPSYVTPCYPALALCCGWTLVQCATGKLLLPRWWIQGILIGLAMIGVGISAGLAVVCTQMMPATRWPMGLGLIWVAAAGLGWCHLRHADWDRWLKVFCGASVAFAVGLFGFAATAVSRTQETDLLIGALRARGNPAAAYRCLESSWIYYAGQPIIELATETDMTVRSEVRTRFWEPKPRWEPAEFSRRFPNGSIITTEEGWRDLRGLLPSHFVVVQRVPFFMHSGDLLLIAPSGSVHVAEQNGDVDGFR